MLFLFLIRVAEYTALSQIGGHSDHLWSFRPPSIGGLNDHLFGKKLFIRFTVRACLSRAFVKFHVYCVSFPFLY